jgi:hypothetical protein
MNGMGTFRMAVTFYSCYHRSPRERGRTGGTGDYAVKWSAGESYRATLIFIIPTAFSHHTFRSFSCITLFYTLLCSKGLKAPLDLLLIFERVISLTSSFH